MIIRIFRSRVKAEFLESLDEGLTEVTVPLVKNQEGLVCYYIGSPTASNANEFLVLTVWKDLEALKKSSGADWEKPVIPQPMAAILEASFVHHYSAL
jgi:quinol monooxygenase YgiN